MLKRLNNKMKKNTVKNNLELDDKCRVTIPRILKDLANIESFDVSLENNIVVLRQAINKDKDSAE